RRYRRCRRPERRPSAGHRITMSRAKKSNDLKTFLDKKVAEDNRPSFIVDDPISIPHQFPVQQDIEIAGFFTAIFSWGNRTTIIRKTQELMRSMDKELVILLRQNRGTDTTGLWASRLC